MLLKLRYIILINGFVEDINNKIKAVKASCLSVLIFPYYALKFFAFNSVYGYMRSETNPVRKTLNLT